METGNVTSSGERTSVYTHRIAADLWSSAVDNKKLAFYIEEGGEEVKDWQPAG
jgi:hypothetical protein